MKTFAPYSVMSNEYVFMSAGQALQYIFICCLKNEESVNVYPIVLVNDKECGIIGSCATYATRRDVTDDVRHSDGLLTLSAVHQRLSSCS